MILSEGTVDLNVASIYELGGLGVQLVFHRGSKTYFV